MTGDTIFLCPLLIHFDFQTVLLPVSLLFLNSKLDCAILCCIQGFGWGCIREVRAVPNLQSGVSHASALQKELVSRRGVGAVSRVVLDAELGRALGLVPFWVQV